jgi:ubiquinone/menaquinone biosynthesis C-methylase UbiE
MVTDVHREKSRAAFDRYARHYDVGPCGRHARWLQDDVLAALRCLEFRSLLDVGCGTGAVLEKALAARGHVEAYGIDLSPEMIAVARCRLGDAVDLRVAAAASC